MPEGPQDITTKQLPREDILNGLLKSLEATVKEGFQNQADQTLELVERVRRLEDRMATVETRQDRNSDRAQALSMRTSSTDLGQDAAIAALTAKVSQVESTLVAAAEERAQTQALVREIRAAVGGFLKEHPVISAAFVGLIVTALNVATSWLLHGGSP
jgi:multidrug resistance efflux pump